MPYSDRSNGPTDPVTLAPMFGTIAAVTAAGSAQGDAAALSAGINLVSGADGAKGVILPAATAANGKLGTVVIINNITAAALLVYPATGGTVSSGATNASASIASGSNAILFSVADNTWRGFEAPKV